MISKSRLRSTTTNKTNDKRIVATIDFIFFFAKKTIYREFVDSKSKKLIKKRVRFHSSIFWFNQFQSNWSTISTNVSCWTKRWWKRLHRKQFNKHIRLTCQLIWKYLSKFQHQHFGRICFSLRFFRIFRINEYCFRRIRNSLRFIVDNENVCSRVSILQCKILL